ncbi:hypothetical protein ACIBJI_03630 [Nocardia sp. NPDC050408]|uniref:hypothetical protein n=1 Tax=Nocardia sp. NPDC050408 TaxID=3364319 RepID=UPI0037BCB8CC
MLQNSVGHKTVVGSGATGFAVGVGLVADRDDAPAAYRTHTTELVLHRPPLGVN